MTTVTTKETESAQPALTHEQYERMTSLNARIKDLKQFGFDMQERQTQLQNEIQRGEEELEKVRSEIATRGQEMQECYDEYIFKPYNITGQISIADTEPHFITVAETAE